jgi:hypothetical protein
LHILDLLRAKISFFHYSYLDIWGNEFEEFVHTNHTFISFKNRKTDEMVKELLDDKISSGPSLISCNVPVQSKVNIS